MINLILVKDFDLIIIMIIMYISRENCKISIGEFLYIIGMNLIVYVWSVMLLLEKILMNYLSWGF